jgi:hypothetical protein
MFDATRTLEGLKQYEFKLPFDLDVPAFVDNVIKPVVERFLAAQSARAVAGDAGKTPAADVIVGAGGTAQKPDISYRNSLNAHQI